MNLAQCQLTVPAYAGTSQRYLGKRLSKRIFSIGNPDILENRLLALICSIRCPGSIVIQTFDAMRALRDAGVVVIGGFHSPMERECLDILLRGSQPVILCAAKRLRGLRLGAAARKALKDGRLLLITPFGDRVKRTTSAQAVQRNELVAALAETVLVPYAVTGGRTDATARNALARGQPLFTFGDENNAHLIHAGAEPYNLDRVKSMLQDGKTEFPKRLTHEQDVNSDGCWVHDATES